MRTAKDIIQLP